MSVSLRVVAAGVLAAVFASASAQSLKDAKPVFRSGNWSVLRSLDSMTDKVTCTGIYKTNYGVQLSPNNLFVRILGGIQSVTLRFGDDPASPMRLPEKLEKDVGSVIITGTELDRALASDRLRVQVLTLVRGVFNEDLDTRGIKEAMQNIQDGCPDVAPAAAPAPAVATQPSAAPAAQTTADEQSCSDQLVARLKAAGVTQRQIAVACHRH